VYIGWIKNGNWGRRGDHRWEFPWNYAHPDGIAMMIETVVKNAEAGPNSPDRVEFPSRISDNRNDVTCNSGLRVPATVSPGEERHEKRHLCGNSRGNATSATFGSNERIMHLLLVAMLDSLGGGRAAEGDAREAEEMRKVTA